MIMVKVIIGAITSMGVSQVVGNVVNATTPDNLKTAQKAATVVGGMVLSAALGTVAGKYMEDQYNEVEAMFKKKPEDDDVEEGQQ